MQPVIDYYDKLASRYDQDRFGNSYGAYIDALERQVIATWLVNTPAEKVIDFGCGTGRLLNFAMTGVDGSTKMLEIAATKFPDRKLHHCDLTQLDPSSLARTYSAGLCFHVLMHISEAEIRTFLSQAAALIGVADVLIVDIPSATRRRLGRRPASGWHGDSTATLGQFAAWANPQWHVSRWQGLLLLPIHRFPAWLRPWLKGLDQSLCRTVLGRLASYYVIELKRKNTSFTPLSSKL